MSITPTDKLRSLGAGHTEYPVDYDPALLETFDNAHPGREYLVTLDCPEFTSLCPKTRQPDCGHLHPKGASPSIYGSLLSDSMWPDGAPTARAPPA